MMYMIFASAVCRIGGCTWRISLHSSELSYPSPFIDLTANVYLPGFMLTNNTSGLFVYVHWLLLNLYLNELFSGDTKLRHSIFRLKLRMFLGIMTEDKSAHAMQVLDFPLPYEMFAEIPGEVVFSNSLSG